MKTLTVRIPDAQAVALQALAVRIGNGATVTGMLRQMIEDRIASDPTCPRCIRPLRDCVCYEEGKE